MSLNLLDAIKNEVSSTVIDKISNYLGEGRGNTSNAITAAIPAVLAFLSKKSETESGAASLIKLATDSDLMGMFSGNSFTDVFEGNRDSLMSKGNSMLIDLFGSKEADLSREISNYANIGKESSDGILASILPLIMSVLGGKISSEGLNPASLVSLFAGEKQSIFSAIPAALASLGGLLGLGKISDFVGDAAGVVSGGVDAVTDAGAKVTSTVSDGVKNISGGVRDTVKETTSYVSNDHDNNNGGGFMKWLLPLLGILAALALLWFLMQKCNDDKPIVDENTTEEVVNVDETEVTTERTLGDIAMGDVNLQAYPGGIEDQLIAFINSDDYKNATNEELKEKWFSFDDLNFEFGTTTLTPESKRQLDNIVAILKAYPDVKMKLGAYTDKKGDDASNLALSQRRADAVKAALDANGVGAQITGAEGYGEQFATVAEDASDEEREADRKTAVRLAK